MRSSVVILGVKFWPIQWRFVLRVGAGSLYHLIQFYAGALAMALLVPTVPEFARDVDMARLVAYARHIVPAEWQGMLPLLMVGLLMGDQPVGLIRRVCG